jgi:hypothetical protein
MKRRQLNKWPWVISLVADNFGNLLSCDNEVKKYIHCDWWATQRMKTWTSKASFARIWLLRLLGRTFLSIRTVDIPLHVRSWHFVKRAHSKRDKKLPLIEKNMNGSSVFLSETSKINTDHHQIRSIPSTLQKQIDDKSPPATYIIRLRLWFWRSQIERNLDEDDWEKCNQSDSDLILCFHYWLIYN